MNGEKKNKKKMFEEGEVNYTKENVYKQKVFNIKSNDYKVMQITTNKPFLVSKDFCSPKNGTTKSGAKNNYAMLLSAIFTNKLWVSKGVNVIQTLSLVLLNNTILDALANIRETVIAETGGSRFAEQSETSHKIERDDVVKMVVFAGIIILLHQIIFIACI